VEKYKMWFSELLRCVVWCVETNVSGAVRPPSSGLKFVIKEMYPLPCIRTQNRDFYFSAMKTSNNECITNLSG